MRHSIKTRKILAVAIIACMTVPHTAGANAFFRYKALQNHGFEEEASTIEVSASGTQTDKQSRLNGDAPEVSYSASGGAGSYSWSVSGSLPSGIAFNNGSFSGAATETGSFPVTISATDGELTGTLDDVIIIRPDLQLAASPAFTGQVNSPMGAVIGVSGDIGSLTWQITGGDPLTDGITLQNGVVSGTPTVEEDTSVQIMVTDSYDGQTATTTANFWVGGEFFVSASSSEISGRVGTAITPVSFTANGLTGAAEWLIENAVAGSLYGMNASFTNASGSISGTPTQGFTGQITVSVRDAANDSSDSTEVDLNIVESLSAEVASTHEFGAGSYVSVNPFVENAIGEVSWALTSGTLPGWATLDTSNGSISGTPDTFATTSGLVLTATDAGDGATASTSPFSITISSGLHVTLNNDNVRARTETQTTWATASASGNTVPVDWSIDTSGLPDGSSVSINENGTISGSVSEAGSFTANVTATEGADPLAGNAGASDTKTVSFTVNDPIQVGEVILDEAGYEVATSLNVAAPSVSNGIGTLSYDLSGDPLPFSISLNPTSGQITGNSSESNSSGLSCVMVTDDWDGSQACSPNFTILVNDAAVSPELAEFKPVTEAEPSQLTYSNIVAIEPQAVAMSVSVTGTGNPEIRALCDTCDNSAYGDTISLPTNENFSLQLRATSSEGFGETVATNALFTFEADNPEDVTVGWPITNKDEDGDPDTLIWDNNAHRSEYPDTLIGYVRPQTVTGINVPVAISVSGPGNPEISLDDGTTWVTSGDIENGESFLVRQTSNANQGNNVTASIDIGPDSYSWIMRTGVYDDEPVILLTDRNELVTDELVTTGYLVPIGYNMPINVSVSGDGQPEIKVPGGDWTTEATVTPGTGFNLRANAASTTNTVNTISITAGQTFRDWLLETCGNVVDGVCGILVQHEIAEIFPNDPDTGNSFGDLISVHGNLAAVAHKSEPSNVGSVYIFEYVGNTWVQVQKITSPSSYSGFGSSVAIHSDINGSVLVVGAPQYGAGGRGRAYVYEGGAGSFVLTDELNADDNGIFDKFGTSVDTNGDTIVVGSPWHGGSLLNPYGAIYTFGKGGEGWTQASKLTASDQQAGDFLGGRVKISEFGTIAASIVSSNRGNHTGALYVFDVLGGGNETQILTASDGGTLEHFGEAFDISGNVIAVGARAAGEERNGKAYVFSRNGQTWSEGIHLVAPDEPNYGASTNFGSAITIENDLIVVGASYANNGEGGDAIQRTGALYTYSGSGAWSWNAQKKLILSEAVTDDRLGFTIATNGNEILSSVVSGPGSFFHFED